LIGEPEMREEDHTIDEWIPPPVYDQIIKWIPILCVDLVIYDRNKGVLLIRRAYPPSEGLWCLVGGMVQRSELIESAVKRHAKTETGLEVEMECLIGIYDDPLRDSMINDIVQYPLYKNKRTITLAYLCTPLGKNPKPGPEALEIKFFKKLPPKIGFDHKRIILDSKVDIDE